MKGPGRWTRMAYIWPMLQANPPPRRQPGAVSREPEPEEFEEAPQPPAGEPPVQAPEEFEAAPDRKSVV